MAVPNAQAYHDTATITAVKRFITPAPGVNVIKHFFFIADDEAK
jgi:hypothetical protein